MQKEPSFAVGDTVELLTGDYVLLCGWCGIARLDNELCERPVDEDTDASGEFEVDSAEYELGDWTYTIQNKHGNVVVEVKEQDLRRV